MNLRVYRYPLFDDLWTSDIEECSHLILSDIPRLGQRVQEFRAESEQGKDSLLSSRNATLSLTASVPRKEIILEAKHQA